MSFEADRDRAYPNYDVNKWHDAINFFELLQKDYQAAHRQLDEINQTISEREAEVTRQLNRAIILSSGYYPLRLSSSEDTGPASLIGNSILANTIPLQLFPKSRRLEVSMLGQFKVRSNTKPVGHWHSAKARSILEYILTKPHSPVLKDALMETLWPDCDAESAGNNLKTAIYGLKKTLTDLYFNDESFPYIIFNQGGYRLNQNIDLWIDVEDFEKHWLSGRRLGKEGKLEQAAHEFELAELLYQGDYLEEELFEDWTLHKRESLKDMYLSILAALADISLIKNDYEKCIFYCQKILDKDNCREEAYRGLMRCHCRLGRRNRALDWYDICRRTILSAMDTIPDPETTKLYEKLRKNESI